LQRTEHHVRELEETPGADLDKLGQALELAKMAKLAAMRRTPRRAEAAFWGEPMRPVSHARAASSADAGEGVSVGRVSRRRNPPSSRHTNGGLRFR